MNPHFWHGSAHGGAQCASQVGPMRPMPGWAQHRMPIPGLYQTGATTHPGGSVTGGPGRNAAAVILKDFGTSIEEVVNKKARSEEHTSELQSLTNLVCRLLLEKKKKKHIKTNNTT